MHVSSQCERRNWKLLFEPGRHCLFPSCNETKARILTPGTQNDWYQSVTFRASLPRGALEIVSTRKWGGFPWFIRQRDQKHHPASLFSDTHLKPGLSPFACCSTCLSPFKPCLSLSQLLYHRLRSESEDMSSLVAEDGRSSAKARISGGWKITSSSPTFRAPSKYGCGSKIGTQS